MIYAIQYSADFDPKEIKYFPKAILQKIKNAIENKLTTQLEVFGKPLRRSLKGYRSLRVGGVSGDISHCKEYSKNFYNWTSVNCV